MKLRPLSSSLDRRHAEDEDERTSRTVEGKVRTKGFGLGYAGFGESCRGGDPEPEFPYRRCFIAAAASRSRSRRLMGSRLSCSFFPLAGASHTLTTVPSTPQTDSPPRPGGATPAVSRSRNWYS